MKNGELSLYHVLKHYTLKFQHYMHFWTRTVWQTQDKLHEFIVVFNRNLVAYTNLSRFIVINWIILNGFEYFDLNTFSFYYHDHDDCLMDSDKNYDRFFYCASTHNSAQRTILEMGLLIWLNSKRENCFGHCTRLPQNTLS